MTAAGALQADPRGAAPAWGDGWPAREPEWSALLAASAADGLFLSWAWLRRWWEVYGQGARLQAIALHDRLGELAAVAPLCLRHPSARGVRGGQELAFLGSGEVGSDYLDLIVRREGELRWRQALVEAMLAAPGWDVLRLEGIPEGSPTVEVAAAALRCRRLAFRVETEDVCPYLPLPAEAGGVSALFARGLHADIRRKWKALEREGEVAFTVVSEPEALADAVAAFERLNQRRLAEKGIRGGFRSARFAAFQRRVAGDLFARGELRLCLLRLSGTPIAGLWIFANGGRYLYYQSGFDPAWARVSPGTLIFGQAIQQAVREGMREFDFLRGQEAYKARWTGRTRRLLRLVAYRRTPAGVAARLSDGALGALRRLRSAGASR